MYLIVPKAKNKYHNPLLQYRHAKKTQRNFIQCGCLLFDMTTTKTPNDYLNMFLQQRQCRFVNIHI